MWGSGRAGNTRRRDITGRSLIHKVDDRGDLEFPNYPPCHVRNGGHDIHETDRVINARGGISVIAHCKKCQVVISETIDDT